MILGTYGLLLDLLDKDLILFVRLLIIFLLRHFPNKPVMMVLSFPSPHGPEDAAPQFHHLFKNVTTHRYVLNYFEDKHNLFDILMIIVLYVCSGNSPRSRIIEKDALFTNILENTKHR
ncbi:hypothetical protein AVEN_237449-1 [Araneus ventricosus]|uniref:Uncharacterized protein n=2 Tax=Araneus ventricosus TaxID=182803 RepID=A0A4Y2HTC1_ARAVE|nr:hypothetical protein AVEN_237449-1 [Araneus ventricosus]